MTTLIQNMSLQRKDIVQRHQAELDAYWQSFFTEASKLMQNEPEIKSLEIKFGETHDGTVYVSELNVDAYAENKTAELLAKIVYTNLDSLVQDYGHLYAGDNIKVTSEGVEGRFCKYGNWNIETPAPVNLGL